MSYPHLRVDGTLTAFLLRRAALEVSLMLRVEAGYRPHPGWRNARACVGKPVQWWFNGKDRGKAICRGCPVRMDCVAAECERDNDLDLWSILGYVGVPSRMRVAWQRRRRGLT